MSEAEDPVLMPVDSELSPFYEVLRSVLAEKGVSYAELERRTGYAHRYVSRVMRGEVRLSLAHVLRFLKAAEIDPADFFSRIAARYREEEEPLSDEQFQDILRRVMPTIEKLVREAADGDPSDS